MTGKSLPEILWNKQDDNWIAVETYISSSRPNEISQADLYLLLRQSENRPPISIHTISMIVNKNHNIVDRNLLLTIFGSHLSIPIETISFLLDHFCSVSDKTKMDTNWMGKFLCSICFGYCPVNMEAVRMFIQRFPQALIFSDSCQKLFPIHKACQLKFRRRAKQESLRDTKSLFQMLLRENISRGICGKDSIGGIFKSRDNNIDGFSMLVKNVGEDTAWDWVLSALKGLHDIPIMQAIFRFDCKKYQYLRGKISHFQHATTTRDSEDNLPLHVAITQGIQWNCGLKDIVEGNPDALDQYCKTTGQLPFDSMILSSRRFELSTIYSFIKFCPLQLRIS